MGCIGETMIKNQKQYGIAVEKIAKLHKYLRNVQDFPVQDKTIQTAIESGARSLTEEIEEECVDYLKEQIK